MQRAWMICISILLVAQAASALRAGRITIAGMCVGGFVFAVVALRRSYRAGPKPGHGLISASAAPITRGAALAALVYPEQLVRVGELLAAIGPAFETVVVLIVSPTPAPLGAPAISSAEDVLRRRDPKLLDDLARG